MSKTTATTELFKKQNTLDLLTRGIILCLGIQMLLTPKLWLIADRDFPLLPVFPFSLPLNFDPAFSLFVFIALMVGFVILLFRPGQKFTFVSVLLLLLFLILQDLNRLQVWMYQLLLMFLILVFRKEDNERLVFKTLQLVLVCVYIWAGLSKFNIYFVTDVFPWMLSEPEFLQPLMSWAYLPYFIAAFEVMIGFGLLIPRLRWMYVPTAIIFHVLVLMILGPLGHNWNIVVWPWNIFMIGAVLLLFYKKQNRIFEDFKYTLKNFPVFAYCLVLTGFLPALNWVGIWDEQLSFKMYSGTNPEAVFYFDESDRLCFPPDMESLFVGKGTEKTLVLDDWSFGELKVSPYLNKNTIVQLQSKLCQCLEQPQSGGLKVLYVDRWNKESDRWEEWPCE